jgi:hypothetical protein
MFMPKPGQDMKFPQNYRAISLSSIGEVLERVILTRLVRVTNENGVLPDEQFGFRPQHSTSDQLIHVTEFISKSSSFTTVKFGRVYGILHVFCAERFVTGRCSRPGFVRQHSALQLADQ